MSKHFGSLIIDNIIKMKKEGRSNCEIIEHFNLSKKQLENLLTCNRIKQGNVSKCIFPKPKNHPKSRKLTKQEELELENKELKTENVLFRLRTHAKKNAVYAL